MRSVMSVLAILALGCVLALNVQAADKEVTLKGKIMCAKCELKLKGVSKCTTCIQVKEGDKDVVYLFLDKGNKEEYHEAVCGGGKKEGVVTGTIAEKDGQKWIKPSKVMYAGAAEKGAMMGPMWMKDYATGLKCSREQHKPLAIFVGCGADGWRKVVRGGKPGAKVENMLGKEFVCVYLDAETPAGKQMAATLKVSDDMGVVLGDRAGTYIDHRHNGSMSEDELSDCLSRCCAMNMNGHEGHDMSGGSTNGMKAMGAMMQAPAAGRPSCCGR